MMAGGWQSDAVGWQNNSLGSCWQESLQGLMGVVRIDDKNVGFLRGATNTVDKVVEPVVKDGTVDTA
jgi:hypothetical protein